MQARYLEEFTVGERFLSESYELGRDEIIAFASQYDPQPAHLDDEAAQNTLFGGLAASGWHTAAVTMKLMVSAGPMPVGGIIGAGFDEMSWPRPVRPGDTLRVESEVLAARASQSRRGQGILKIRTTTYNQHDEPVQISVGNLFVPCRPG